MKNEINEALYAEVDTDRVIEMAWEDRTPFEAIDKLYGLDESSVIQLMRNSLSSNGFRRWRARVSGRRTKHGALRSEEVTRGYCKTQYKIKSQAKGHR